MKRISRRGVRSARKPYQEMNAEELAAATARFGREDLTAPKPLRGEKLRRYRKAMARRGRPQIGEGSRAITITLERGLLDRADRLARLRGVNRSQLIAFALAAQMADARSGGRPRPRGAKP